MNNLLFNALNDSDSIEWIYHTTIIYDIEAYRKYIVFAYEHNFRIVNTFSFRKYLSNALTTHTIGYLSNIPINKSEAYQKIELIFNNYIAKYG